MRLRSLPTLIVILVAAPAVLLLHSCGGSPTSPSPSNTPTRTFIPTLTTTSTTSSTPTSSATSTSTATSTGTATSSATATPTSSSTGTPTSSATATPTSTASLTSTDTDTSTASPTATDSPTATSSFTPTNTATATDTATLTNTPTATNTAVYPFQQTLASGVTFNCLALGDSGTGSVTILAGDQSNRVLYLYTGTATGSFSRVSVPIAGNGGPTGIAWSSFNSNFYVVLNQGGSAAYVQQLTATGGNPGGGGAVTWGGSTLTGGANYVAVDASGNVYVADTSNGLIYPFSPTGSAGTTFGNNFIIQGIAYDKQNNQLLVPETTGGGAVSCLRSNLNGTSTTSFSVGTNTGGIAADASGDFFLCMNVASGDTLDKYNGSDSLLASFATYGSGAGQLKYPQAIAVDSQGYLYVSDTMNDTLSEFAPH